MSVAGAAGVALPSAAVPSIEREPVGGVGGVCGCLAACWLSSAGPTAMLAALCGGGATHVAVSALCPFTLTDPAAPTQSLPRSCRRDLDAETYSLLQSCD